MLALRPAGRRRSPAYASWRSPPFGGALHDRALTAPQAAANAPLTSAEAADARRERYGDAGGRLKSGRAEQRHRHSNYCCPRAGQREAGRLKGDRAEPVERADARERVTG